MQGEGAEGQCFRPQLSAWGSVGVSPSLMLDPCGQTLQSSEYGGESFNGPLKQSGYWGPCEARGAAQDEVWVSPCMCLSGWGA